MFLSMQPGTELGLEQMFERSHQLHERIFQILGDDGFHELPRLEAAVGMCSVALEHAHGHQALMALAIPNSAVSLMRHQFEALTRAMWLLYAAPDVAIAKLLAPLTVDNEQAAKNLPGAIVMIEDLRKRIRSPGQGIPAGAHQMLTHFKEVTWPAMNSFVHSGLHALRRTADGFPVMPALQILRNSNGLTDDRDDIGGPYGGADDCQRDYADCLQDLQERAAGG